jgi:mRNA interferase MazF
MTTSPIRGDIWLADLNPINGREQAGMRPCLVVSVNLFNQSPAELVIVVPLTTRAKGIRTHVPLVPPEGGVRERSFIKKRRRPFDLHRTPHIPMGCGFRDNHEHC